VERRARAGPLKALEKQYSRHQSALLKSLSLLCGFSLLGFGLIQLAFSWFG
jgi:hypothetical protein